MSRHCLDGREGNQAGFAVGIILSTILLVFLGSAGTPKDTPLSNWINAQNINPLIYFAGVAAAALLTCTLVIGTCTALGGLFNNSLSGDSESAESGCCPPSRRHAFEALPSN